MADTTTNRDVVDLLERTQAATKQDEIPERYKGLTEEELLARKASEDFADIELQFEMAPYFGYTSPIDASAVKVHPEPRDRVDYDPYLRGWYIPKSAAPKIEKLKARGITELDGYPAEAGTVNVVLPHGEHKYFFPTAIDEDTRQTLAHEFRHKRVHETTGRSSLKYQIGENEVRFLDALTAQNEREFNNARNSYESTPLGIGVTPGNVRHKLESRTNFYKDLQKALNVDAYGQMADGAYSPVVEYFRDEMKQDFREKNDPSNYAFFGSRDVNDPLAQFIPPRDNLFRYINKRLSQGYYAKMNKALKEERQGAPREVAEPPFEVKINLVDFPQNKANGGEVGLEQELQSRIDDPTDYYSQLFPEETSRIEAPRYPTVAKIGQGLESFSRHLEQQSPLLSLVDPVAGIGPYLTRLGYGQKSTPLEVGFAALDVFGGVGDVAGIGADVVTPTLAMLAGVKAQGRDVKKIKKRVDKLREKGLEGQELWDAQTPKGLETFVPSKSKQKKGYYDPSDNKFRFEIDTKEVDLKLKPSEDGSYIIGRFDLLRGRDNPRPTEPLRLPEILDFPEIFERYPEFKTTEVRPIGSGELFTLGKWDAENNVMYLKEGKEKETILSTILHELQHGIQKKEGFLGGGSPGMFLPEGFGTSAAYKRYRDFEKALRKSTKFSDKDFNIAYEAVEALITDNPRLTDPSLPKKNVEDIVNKYFVEQEQQALEYVLQDPLSAGSSPEIGSAGLFYLLTNDNGKAIRFDTNTNAEKKIELVQNNVKNVRELLKEGKEIGSFYKNFQLKDKWVEKDEAQQLAKRRYLRIPGEVEARNVQLAFEGLDTPYFPKAATPEEVKQIFPPDRQRLFKEQGILPEDMVYPLHEEYRNPLKKAQGGGVSSLASMARDMNHRPRGMASLSQIARNMHSGAVA